MADFIQFTANSGRTVFINKFPMMNRQRLGFCPCAKVTRRWEAAGMANKPCMGLIRCQCGIDIPVVWNGNHSFSCPYFHRKLNVKRQRMKKVRHVDPAIFNSGRADNGNM